MIHPPMGTSISDLLGKMGHAYRIGPLAESLVASLFLSPLNADKHHHEIYSSHGGPNSWGLYLADGRQFHFRGGSHTTHYDCIEVYDRYRRNGYKPVIVLRTRHDCRVWASKLSYNVFIAKKNGVLRAA